MNLKVRYVDGKLTKLRFEKQHWIDIRVSRIEFEDGRIEDNGEIKIKKGELVKVYHGINVEAPEGYECRSQPRSSLGWKKNLLFATSGVIDYPFKGNEDEWSSVLYAIRDTSLKFDERICQFKVQKQMEDVEIEEVAEMTGPSRGGYGKSGEM